MHALATRPMGRQVDCEPNLSLRAIGRKDFVHLWLGQWLHCASLFTGKSHKTGITAQARA